MSCWLSNVGVNNRVINKISLLITVQDMNRLMIIIIRGI